MSINTKTPSFISYLDNVTNIVLKNITVDTYFTIPNEKKIGVMYMVFKLIKNTISSTSKLTDDEIKGFLIALCKKNEIVENYEFSEIIKNIVDNYEVVNELCKTTKTEMKQLNRSNQD